MNVHWRAPAGLHTASAELPDEGEPAFVGRRDWSTPNPGNSRYTNTQGCWPRYGCSSDTT